VQEEHVMNQEYGKAQENFRKISTFKKAVDKRGGPKPATAFAAAAAHSGHQPQSPAPTQHQDAASSAFHSHSAAHGQPSAAHPSKSMNPVEESKINAQLDAIRSFVRVAEKSCHVVPLTKGNLNITPQEADALRADYAHEKSFRADYANAMSILVAIMARLIVEEVEFREKGSSSYLWKPHADAITYLVHRSQEAFATVSQMVELCEKRGLKDKAEAIKATSLKLRVALQQSAATLKSAGT
jgi:hypothetical protein